MIFRQQIGFLVLLFLSGCMVGPKYEKPSVKLPDKYAEQHQAGSQGDLARWWAAFEDPCLSILIEKAIKNNFDLRIATEKIEEARAFYRIQDAKLYPDIDAIGKITRNGISKNLTQSASLKESTLNYFQAGFDTLWEIDFWGKLRRSKQAAYNELQAQVEAMRDVYIILLGDIAKAYIDSRTLQKKIDLLNQKIALSTKLISLTDDRFYAGVDNQRADLEQQEELCELRNQLLILQTTFRQTVNKLALLLGEYPERFELAPGDHVVPQYKKNLGIGLPSELLRRRPDIRRAEKLLAAATERVGQAIADWFPSFSLLGLVDFEANKGSKWFSSNSFSWSIGPSVRWPIITFGRIQFNIDEKKSIQKQAFLAYGQAVVKALGDVENSLVAYFNGQKEVAVLCEKLLVATRKSDLAYEVFCSGLVNEIDFLLAEKNRLTIEAELTSAEQAASVALVSMYKALGGEW